MKQVTGKNHLDILIVEDSRTQAAKLQYILEKKDFKVSLATNGKEALHLLKRQVPDIVVSDIMMPEMDGYELCKRIRSDEKLREVPVILVTSLSEPTDVIKGLEAGANNFITKPYDEKFIVSRIEYLIANKGLRKEATTEKEVKVFFLGKNYCITAERLQILDLLLSTYENAYHQNRELLTMQKKLQEFNEQLQEALTNIKTLSGLIPICASCKKIRQDSGYWQQIEAYISDHSEAKFSHGICPECVKKLYPDIYDTLALDKK
jgi:two-component system, OmpR family, response regulator VanR